MKKVIILGAGMMGHVMAKELTKVKDYDLTIADFSEDNLKLVKELCPQIKTKQVDFSIKGEAAKAVMGFDLIVGALPKFLASDTCMEILATGIDMVEVSGLDYANKSEADRKAMEDAAKKSGATICLGLGLAPGMINVITGYACTQLDRADKAELLVGGLPVAREQPWEYKLVFSLIGTVGQFVFPVKVVKNHQIEVIEACSEIKQIEVEGIGTLEAFTTNGLTSLMHTYKDKIKDMKEMTLRYPGHTEKMKMLRESGLLSYDEIEFKGAKFRPVDFTCECLLPHWKLKKGEAELTPCYCDIEGVKDGKHLKLHWETLDYYDPETDYTSMARTTCFPALIMAEMITNGEFKYSGGLCHPEFVGEHQDIFHKMMDRLAERGVIYKHSVEELD